MAIFGGYFRANDGSLAVTSDTPCYELHGEHAVSSRTGNVNTYAVNTPVFPLVFVVCGVGNKAGVLAIGGSAGNWTISVLANVACNILSFKPITGNTSSGYGIATYDSLGNLVFDSDRKILNSKHVNVLSEETSFQSTSGVNSVAYTSGPVKPTKSQSESWVLVEAYGYTDTQYVCNTEIQYNCYQEQVFVCNQVYVCTPVFSCNFDPFSGGFSCGFVDSCSYQVICGFETQTNCRTEVVQVCSFVSIASFASIEALVRTTDWTIERGVASISSAGSIAFEWLLHKSGYYKEVVQYRTLSYSFNLTGAGLPIGYVTPIAFLQVNESFEGELTKNNSFPYTTDRANTGALTCITAIRSDYD